MTASPLRSGSIIVPLVAVLVAFGCTTVQRMVGFENQMKEFQVQARVEAQGQALTIRAWDYGHVDLLHSA